MYAALSRLVVFACTPLGWTLALGLLALLLRWRRPRAAFWVALLAGLVLAAFSSDAVADPLSAALERGVATTYRPDPPYDVVVVLGGAIDAPAARASGELELTEAGERLTRGFEVWRAGAARHVLVSGGTIDPVPGERPEAEVFAEALRRWGVPADQVVAEGRSRNTRENAEETARIVADRGWTRVLLVTSAAHMPRALGCFRKAGLSPDALPTDHRAGDGRGRSWLPGVAALDRSSAALRELTGRLAYRLLGYTAP